MGLLDWLRGGRGGFVADACVRSVSAEAARVLLKRVESLPAGGRVLELGCDVGALSLRLAQARPGIHVTGLDPRSAAVRHADHAARAAGLESQVSFQRSDLRILPLADEAFDLVLGVGILAASGNPVADLVEVERVMKRGARALFLEPLVQREPKAGEPARGLHRRGAAFDGPTLKELVLASRFAAAARVTCPEARGLGVMAELEFAKR
jgi:ubiquinone/menaquinone biosynthesis C-methylase UbiE